MTLNAARGTTATADGGRGRPGRPAAGRTRGRAMTPLMSSCVVLVVAMVAAINLALPKLSAADLHPSSSQLLWIVDTYVLMFGCLLIPAGALGDRYGRKGVLLSGLGVFAAGCLLSAAAPTVGVLIAGRLITGVGAALIMPATLSLLLQVTAPERRPHAIATWTAATGIAGAVGNLGGGAVLEWLSWQCLFLAGAGAAAALAALTAWLAPPGERHPAALDLPGAVLLTLALFALLFGIIEGSQEGWTSAPVLGAFAASAVLAGAFTVHSLRAERPLLDLRIFARPRLRSGVLGVGLAFFGLFALFFVNAQYLQYAKGYSPLLTGVAIAPLVVGMVVVSKRSIGLARRFGERPVVALGLLLVAAGLGLLGMSDASTPYPLYAATLVVMSAGMGLCMPSLSVAVMSALPPGQAGLGSGLNSASREIGSALGVAVFGTILTSEFSSRLSGHPRSIGQALADGGGHGAVTAFTDAMSTGLTVVAVIVLVGALVIVPGFRRPN